ncbi:sugar ABC transporter ATP-binding protein, partial [bacterium M00.F.Ca.ET.229.01.1.1]
RVNLTLASLKKFSRLFQIDTGRETTALDAAVRDFDIRTGRKDLLAGQLSGGNQQKVVLAKEILGNPRLLLLDEPTRGVDVGAKGEIYARLRALAAQGLGILVASSEMP